ncbi:MAG: serine/threonine protein kinase, partial [Phycisphaerales bacterium]|nr:serine/threonine protein kinase [Phycisphaerales bacterium]
MSDAADHTRLSIFRRALPLSGAARTRFLDEVCGADATLRSGVEAMLTAHERGGDESAISRATTRGAAAAATVVAASADELPDAAGVTLDKYTLVRKLGEGGFGVVYLAEQVEPVRRQVAVKIIKLGMDTREVIARFEAERQALALMDHPGIATVLDAGATEAGRPYFVMELVRGESITSYCDRHNLELSARLALFRQVCQAVQHAHQKGIIHRDLKPSNVLVTLQDNNPVPKVIDFGIAKATHQRLTERTMFTEHRQLIGTPEYMSPEQAEMTGLDIDTRSDIYSLGVLLYELLTGVTPFDSRKLRSAAYGEIQRIIREETPAKPSTRLSSVDSLPSIAAHRQTEPRRLGLMVRGDLDWIVMKALEKDRTRRYDTASAFAADIERYLENEPVEASPPSAVYRVRKFVKRHRGRVIAASLVVAVFLLGSVGTAGGLIWALNENERANDAATRAEAKEESARHMLDFFVDLFDEASPQRTGGKPMTVLEFLDVGADGIDGLADQPEIQAKMKETIGLLYVVLSEFNKADPLLHEAVDYREADQAGDPASLASSLSALAALYQWTGREEQGLTLAERAVAIWERELGDSTELAESLTVMGNCLQRTGRMDEAIVAHERALAVREAVLPPGDAARSISLHNIGICYFFKNDSPAAETYFKRAIDTYEAAGRRTHGLATSQHVLSIVYFFQKKLQLAEQYQRQAYATRVEVLPAGHDHIALSLITLGNICRDLRRYEESETLLREGLAIHEPKLGSDHGEVWWDKK